MLCFFNSPYLLITFFVLHKSRLSRLTSELPYSLFQLNEFFNPHNELRKTVNTGEVKSAKSKETG